MRESEIIFKLISAEDIPRLKEIMIDDGGCYNAEQLKRFMDHRDIVAFGAFLDNQIIGLIYGYSLCQISDERPQFFIYSVGIHSNYQNKGYGSKFFQYVVDYCRNNGYAEVFVPTDKGNVRACKVYENAGGKSDFDDEIIYVIKLPK